MSTEPSAVVMPTEIGSHTYDMKVFTDARRPLSLYALDVATLKAIHAAIQDTIIEIYPGDKAHIAPVLEFRNLVWLHGNTPPLNDLHEQGWHLVGWPTPIQHEEDGIVRWYATMQRKVGTEAG